MHNSTWISAQEHAVVQRLPSQQSSLDPSTPDFVPDSDTMTYKNGGVHRERLLLREYRDEIFSHSSPTFFRSDNFDSNNNSNSKNNTNNTSNNNNNSNSNSNNISGYESRGDDCGEEDSEGVSVIVSNLLNRQLSTLKNIRYQQEIKDELIDTLKQRIYVLEQDQTCSNNIISELKREVTTLAHIISSKSKYISTPLYT